MNKEALGKFIAENRKALGMTQEELANRLFVTNKAVSKWEKGHSFPDIAMFEPLAEALGVSVAELIACEKKAEGEASIREVIELSCGVIKKYKERFVWALIVLAMVIAYAAIISYEKFDEKTNFPYVYYRGFYFYITDDPVGIDGTKLGEEVACINYHKGRIKEYSNVGDSNYADDGTFVYTIIDDAPMEGYVTEGALGVSVGGRYYIALPYLENLQEYEKFYQTNIGKASK